MPRALDPAAHVAEDPNDNINNNTIVAAGENVFQDEAEADIIDGNGCPICRVSPPERPCYLATCSHVYCAKCILSCLKSDVSCPVCRRRYALHEVILQETARDVTSFLPRDHFYTRNVDRLLSQQGLWEAINSHALHDQASPFANTPLYNTIFIQAGTIGLASYHFEREPYICYSNAPRAWRLSDGSSPPEKKFFENFEFDVATREFRADIHWEPDFAGAIAWRYTMVFAENFCEIESGTVEVTNVGNGPGRVDRFVGVANRGNGVWGLSYRQAYSQYITQICQEAGIVIEEPGAASVVPHPAAWDDEDESMDYDDVEDVE